MLVSDVVVSMGWLAGRVGGGEQLEQLEQLE